MCNVFKKSLLVGIFLALFGGCAKKGGGDEVVEGTFNLEVDSDIDGDFLSDSVDPDPLIANLPKLSLNIKEVKPSFIFRGNSGLVEFKPYLKESSKLEIFDSRRVESLRAVGNYLKTGNKSYLAKNIDLEQSFWLRPISEKDTILTEGLFHSLDVLELIEDSGELEILGSVSMSSKKDVKTSNHYISLYKDKNMLGSTLLGNSGADISMRNGASDASYAVNFLKINAFSVKNLLLNEKTHLKVKIKDYDIERNNQNFSFKKVYSNVLRKTVAVLIIKDNEVLKYHIAFKGELKESLKLLSDSNISIKNGEIDSFLGIPSSLTPTNDIPALQGNFQGKWFLLSKRNLSLESLIGPGDSFSLVYATGDEISTFSKKTKRIRLHNFTGKSRDLLSLDIDKILGIKLFVQPVKTFGSKVVNLNAKKSRFPSGCHGFYQGQFLDSFESEGGVDDKSFEKLSLILNGEKIESEEFLEDQSFPKINTKSFYLNNDLFKDLTTLKVDSGNISLSSSVRLTNNTCYPFRDYERRLYDFGDLKKQIYHQFNINLLIEYF